MKGRHFMKTTTDRSKYGSKHRKAGLILSLLCAGVVASFMGGCAETGYYAYDRGYYPTSYGTYYAPNYYDYGPYYGYGYYGGYPYSYYGPSYSGSFVVGGTRVVR
jgi:hypothetical protein